MTDYCTEVEFNGGRYTVVLRDHPLENVVYCRQWRANNPYWRTLKTGSRLYRRAVRLALARCDDDHRAEREDAAYREALAALIGEPIAVTPQPRSASEIVSGPESDEVEFHFTLDRWSAEQLQRFADYNGYTIRDCIGMSLYRCGLISDSEGGFHPEAPFRHPDDMTPEQRAAFDQSVADFEAAFDEAARRRTTIH